EGKEPGTRPRGASGGGGGGAAGGLPREKGGGDAAAPPPYVKTVLIPTPANDAVGDPIRMRGQWEVIEGEPPHPRQANAGTGVHRVGVEALPEEAGRVVRIIVVTPGHGICRSRHLDDELAEPRRRHGETRPKERVAMRNT